MIYNMTAQGGITPSGTKTINISSNGTVSEDVTAFATAQVITSVPNTYSAADEGKTVSGSALVAQTTSVYTANGNYNTTTISGITVSINTAPTLQSKSVAFTPAESVLTSTVTADAGYDGLNAVDITVASISSTYVGTGVARKSAADLVVSGSKVTAPVGYYSSAVSANVAAGTATTPSTLINAGVNVYMVSSTGLVSAQASSAEYVTPTIASGYVSQGTSGLITVYDAAYFNLPTQAASTITPTTASQLAVSSYHWTTGSVYVAPIPSAYIVPTGTSNITANGTGINIASYASVNVNVPNSYSAGDAGKVVSGTSLVAQTTSTYTANGSYNTTTISGITISINTAPTLQTKSEAYTPAETVITDSITPDAGYDGLNQVDITVNAISSTYVGSGVPDNGSDEVTITGSQVTVASGYYEYSINKYVPYGHATTPSTTITANPAVTIDASGLITATTSASSAVTPTVSVGYLSVGGGNAGTISANGTGTLQLTTRAGATITPTTASQLAAASGVYTTGSVYVAPIPSAYIIPTGTLSITNNGSSIAVGSYAYVDVDVAGGGGGSVLISDTIDPICGGTIREITASAFTVETLSVSSNGTYSASSGVLWDTVSVSVSGGITPTGTSTINITANGTTTHDVAAFASAQVIANVPNSYSAADEGKVVSGAALVAQTASTVTANATYDTTLINSLTVNVSGGGGGGDNREKELVEHTLSGVYSNSEATKIGRGAFWWCYNLTGVDIPNATTIGSYAFAECSSLTSASFPLVTDIGQYAFSSCGSLSILSFPVAQSISYGAFINCSSLTTIYFPSVVSIGNYAFSGCIRLTSISFPAASQSIGPGAFQRCSALSSVYMLVQYVSNSTFASCPSMSIAEFPYCSIIGSSAFLDNLSLATVIINYSGSTAGSIYAQAFTRCFHLLSLYLLGSTMHPLAAITAFSSTPMSGYTTSTGGISGSIFVKQSLYSTYASATNWVNFYNAGRIASLTDAQVANVIANKTHVI